MSFTENNPDIVFRHYKISGEVEEITQSEAVQRMELIGSHWHSEMVEKGRLHQMIENPTEVPANDKLSKPARKPQWINEGASKEFGTEIMGDCFLEHSQKKPSIEKK